MRHAARYTSSTALKICILSLSAAWGIPWVHAATRAATIFSTPELRAIFGALFAAGIILTVGCDGLWLLLSTVQKIENGFFSSVTHTLKKNLSPEKRKWVIAILCAIISCLPSVYATVIFNTGYEKLWGIVTFVGNMAYGLYGYATLYEKLFTTKKWPRLSMHYREMIIIIFSSFIATSSAIIDFYLTKKFFQHELFSNLFFASVLAMMTVIPGIVANFIASRHLLKRTYYVITHDQHIDRLTLIFTLMIFLIALTAPSAAGFITFTTLQKAGADKMILYTATSVLIIARFLFSNFTMHQLVNTARARFRFTCVKNLRFDG